MCLVLVLQVLNFTATLSGVTVYKILVSTEFFLFWGSSPTQCCTAAVRLTSSITAFLVGSAAPTGSLIVGATLPKSVDSALDFVPQRAF